MFYNFRVVYKLLYYIFIFSLFGITSNVLDKKKKKNLISQFKGEKVRRLVLVLTHLIRILLKYYKIYTW